MHLKFQIFSKFRELARLSLTKVATHQLNVRISWKSWIFFKLWMHRSSDLIGRLTNGWVFWKVQELNYLILWKIFLACLIYHVLHGHGNNQNLNNKCRKCSIQTMLAFHRYGHNKMWPIIGFSIYYPSYCLPNLVSIGHLEIEENNCLLLTIGSWTENV